MHDFFAPHFFASCRRLEYSHRIADHRQCPNCLLTSMKGPTMPTMRTTWLIALALFAIPDLAHADSQVPLWKDGQPKCVLVLPDSDPPSAKIAKATLSRF